MRRTMILAGLTACALAAGAPAAAQTSGAQTSAAPAGGLGGLAGLGGGGLLGGALSSLGGAGVGNAAGLLSYCVKNRLLGGTTATTANSALGKLLGRSDVTGSEGFAAGQSGELQTAQGGQALSLDAVKGKLKTKVCSMVLQHARSFL